MRYPAAIAALLLLTLLSPARPAAACSCAFLPEQDHACVASPNTDAVFSGRVMSVSEKGRRSFRFAVLEAFSGVKQSTVEVETGQGGGDCGYGFEIGKSYLIYAARSKDGKLFTHICTRTRPLEKAASDLDHLRRVLRDKPQVTLFGKVEHVQRSSVNSHPTWKAVKGVQVTAELPGGRKLSTLTNGQGQFEFHERLSGPVTIRAAVPKGLPPTTIGKVTVPAGRCAGVILEASILGRIHGRVVEADGTPAKYVRLSLIPIHGKPDIASAEEFSVENEGLVDMRRIPPGSYLLAVNPLGPTFYGTPHPPHFYPGASIMQGPGAVPIKVGPAETVKLSTFRLPPRLVQRTVSGTVRLKNGRLPTGGWVRVLGPDGDEMPLPIDEAGSFQLQGYEGYRYRLAAEHEGARGVRTHSAPIEVRIGSRNKPLVLRIDRAGSAPLIRATGG